MINWRPVTELPKNGDLVWVLCSHWKRNFPASFRIFAGEMEGDRVCSLDDYGEGSWGPLWPTERNSGSGDEIVEAWVPASEINIAEWSKDENQPSNTPLNMEVLEKVIRESISSIWGGRGLELSDNNALLTAIDDAASAPSPTAREFALLRIQTELRMFDAQIAHLLSAEVKARRAIPKSEWKQKSVPVATGGLTISTPIKFEEKK